MYAYDVVTVSQQNRLPRPPVSSWHVAVEGAPPHRPILTTMAGQFEELTQTLTAFVDERDWQQFHTPKNLVMALSGEVGELTEHFQWLTQEESLALSDAKKSEVADEIADVQFYLLLLARGLGIDVPRALREKLRKNEEKYPAGLVRGSSRKYTEY